MAPDKFKQLLADIVKPGTKKVLHYSGVSDYPVEIVELPWWGYKGKFQNIEPNRFNNQSRMASCQSQFMRWKNLQLLRPTHQWKEFKLARKEPSEFDYYFVTRVGHWWIGIKCRAVETEQVKTEQQMR